MMESSLARIFSCLAFLIVLQLQLSSVAGYCEGAPAAGCANGLWNEDKCQCECIPPFCPDAQGQCYQTTANCGGNPWVECVKGVNCPWWENPLKLESCVTGNLVPPGIWVVYGSLSECCSRLYPNSNVCDAKRTTAPTKYPTISAPPEDEHEIVPIKFTIKGLPNNVKIRELKKEMRDILVRILAKLSERESDLKITRVEERLPPNRVLRRSCGWFGGDCSRTLAKDFDVIFDVYCIRQDGIEFGDIIIDRIRRSYDEIMDDIKAYTDTEYFGYDVDLNWCTTSAGQFVNCATEIVVATTAPTTAPTRRPRVPTGGTLLVQNKSSETSSSDSYDLPIWAIILIVLICILFMCCIGYFLLLSYNRNGKQGKVETNIYLDDAATMRSARRRALPDDHSRYTDDRSKATTIRQLEYQPENEWQIVCSNGEDPSFDDGLTVRTYKTNSSRPDPSLRGGYPVGRGRDGDRSRPDPSVYRGDSSRPDPDSSVLLLTNGDDATVASSRKWKGDPPLKPPREPSLYVDDPKWGDDPSIQYAQYSAEQPDGDVARMRSIYMDGQDPSIRFDQHDAQQPDGDMGDTNSVYTGRADDPSLQFDHHSARQPDGIMQRMKSQYMGSISGAEHMRDVNDASYYSNGGDQSFRTQEPEMVRGRQDPSYYSDTEFDAEGNNLSGKTRKPKNDPSYYSGSGFGVAENSVSGKSGKSKKSSKSKKSKKSTKAGKETKSFSSEPGNKGSKKKKGPLTHESLVSSWGEFANEYHGEISSDSRSYSNNNISRKKSKSFFH